jgi:hypothetical protein
MEDSVLPVALTAKQSSVFGFAWLHTTDSGAVFDVFLPFVTSWFLVVSWYHTSLVGMIP